MPLKRCCFCKQEKPLEAFGKNRSTRDGLQRECKECRRANCYTTREKRLEEQRRTRERRREKQLAEYREWYQKNRERVLEERRLARIENPDKYRSRDREQRQKHPERVKATKRARRARERAAIGTITPAEWKAVCDFYGNRCLRCGADGPLTMDHVKPLSRGGTHTVDNVQPLCHQCNCIKQARGYDYRKVLMPMRQLGMWE